MKDKIKVLIVDGVYPPAYTGAGLRAHRMYKRLSIMYPIEFVVLTTTQGDLKDGYDIYDGVKIYRTKANKSIISQIIQVYHYFKKYGLYKCNIVHGFGDSLVVISACLLGKFYSMKVIIEMTVLIPDLKITYIRLFKNIINYIRFGHAKKFTYKNADLLIALNESIKQYYIDLGISENKIWKRHNPVDTKQFYMPSNQEKENIRESLDVPKNSTIILVVGRFEPRKNQKFALEVLPLLSDEFFLLMAGPSDKQIAWYLAEIQELIGINRIHDKIKIMSGYHPDIEIFYRASDILWIPSHSEGTPNVMLEAMCSGIPVVVNKALGLNEYIDDGGNGFQVPLSAVEFQVATLELFQNIKNLKYKKKITSLAKIQYNADKIDSEYYQRFKKLLIKKI